MQSLQNSFPARRRDHLVTIIIFHVCFSLLESIEHRKRVVRMLSGPHTQKRRLESFFEKVLCPIPIPAESERSSNKFLLLWNKQCTEQSVVNVRHRTSEPDVEEI